MAPDLPLPAAHAAMVRPPSVTWPDAIPDGRLPPRLLEMRCPNCSGEARKSLVLAVDFITPDHPMRRNHLLRCPDCTACFYDDQNPPDYAEQTILGLGRTPFYIQVNAGVSLITRPLAQIRRPAGSAYMEVGCGFGFGLDFAIRTRGWQGRGIDPAALSALGREVLDLPIELRYLAEDDEARGTMDVVMGSEVIEHVRSPAAFLRTLRAMLRPGGVVVLTTPDGADLVPETSPGALVGLLSPGLHLVFQNARSLRRLLAEAGFAHAEIERDGHSLVAFASDAPLDLERDPAALRAAYRGHLIRRTEGLAPGSDISLGFAGRALMECVNDNDLPGADRVWARLVPAVRDRFGLDLDALDRPDALPPGVLDASLEEMAARQPLNLFLLLYTSAIRRLAAGAERPSLEGRFALAAEAAAALRRALGALAMDDGLAEDVGWTATAEATLCAAASGRTDSVSRLVRLPPAPDGSARRRVILERGLSALVNAGHHGLARDLLKAEPLSHLDAAPHLGETGRDAEFACAVLDIQPGGDPARARDRFRRVRAATEAVGAGSGLPPHGSLFWSAIAGEWQACRALKDDPALEAGMKDMVRAASGDLDRLPPALARQVIAQAAGSVQVLAARDRLDEAKPRADWLRRQVDRPRPWLPDAALRDAVFSVAMLDARAGDHAAARAGFARARAGLDAAATMHWMALTAELQACRDAGDADAAERLLAAATTAEALAADPAALTPEAATLRLSLLRGRLVDLVNAARIEEARALVAAGRLDDPPDPLDEGARNAVFALAMLDLQPGGDPERARPRFGRARAGLPPDRDLYWAALRGEAIALDGMGERSAATRLVAEAAAGADAALLPGDLRERLAAAGVA